MGNYEVGDGDMTMLNLPTQITVESLAEAVAQLPPDVLENFLAQVRVIRQRKDDEARLLSVVQGTLSSEQRQRMYELRSKLEAETLTQEEREEFADLIELAEAADVKRAEALLALAKQRGLTVRQLMHGLRGGR